MIFDNMSYQVKRFLSQDTNQPDVVENLILSMLISNFPLNVTLTVDLYQVLEILQCILISAVPYALFKQN